MNSFGGAAPIFRISNLSESLDYGGDTISLLGDFVRAF
jgi:hypothetical protein